MDSFISYLTRLLKDSGAAAALRRGAGKEPGTQVAMFRFIYPFLKATRDPQRERAYFLVASLFALHPVQRKGISVGRAFRRLGTEENVARRFTALLKSHEDDLYTPLFRAITLLKSKDIGLDWSQLTWDILQWDSQNMEVQRRWARDYWRQVTVENKVG